MVLDYTEPGVWRLRRRQEKPKGAISLFIQSSSRLIASRRYCAPLTLMRHVIYRSADYSLLAPARARAATRRRRYHRHRH